MYYCNSLIELFNGAHDLDYKAFMVKDAIMSHNSDYTNQVEDMFGAITYDVVKLIVER